jgi:hypothetical protein
MRRAKYFVLASFSKNPLGFTVHFINNNLVVLWLLAQWKAKTWHGDAGACDDEDCLLQISSAMANSQTIVTDTAPNPHEITTHSNKIWTAHRDTKRIPKDWSRQVRIACGTVL